MRYAILVSSFVFLLGGASAWARPCGQPELETWQFQLQDYGGCNQKPRAYAQMCQRDSQGQGGRCTGTCSDDPPPAPLAAGSNDYPQPGPPQPLPGYVSCSCSRIIYVGGCETGGGGYGGGGNAN